MMRKTLVGWSGLIAVAALLLSGCAPARPSQDQLDAWRAAAETVPDVVGSEVFVWADPEDSNFAIEIWVTISDDATLTYDLTKGVYEALVAATPEKWSDRTALVMFNNASNASDPYSPLSVGEMFANAGVSCEGLSVCASNDGIYLQMSLDANGSGFPPATKTPPVQPRLPDLADLQRQAWIDAAVASNPDVVSAQATEVGDEYSGDAVTFGVTLRAGAPLTYDLMLDVYDALCPVTEVGWNYVEMDIWFSSADDPDTPLPIGGALRDAGEKDPSTGAAYGDDVYFLPVVLIRASGD